MGQLEESSCLMHISLGILSSAGTNMGKDDLIVFFAIFSVLGLEARKVKLGDKDCQYKGEKVCNGAVVKEVSPFRVNACLDGKIKYGQPKAKVAPDYPLVGRDTGPGKDCIWYGTVFCDGDLVEDLHRWWFQMKCSKSKFSVNPRTYAEVRADKRFDKP